MSSVNDQINAIYQANLAVARQFAAISLDGAENLFNVTFNATRKLIENEKGQPNGVWANGALPTVLSTYSSTYQDNLRKVVETTQTYLDEASKAQAELARLIQDQVAAASSNFLDGMQEIAANVGAAQKETHEALERQQSKKVAAS
ncbi:MAG TPA: phasin family protein [Burkholderiales bacterium]|nr:phasin family protein [Burkholderiales bacterium]